MSLLLHTIIVSHPTFGWLKVSDDVAIGAWELD
jgi:hypothetical protein